MTCGILACVVGAVAVGLTHAMREMRIWQVNRERGRQPWEREPEPKPD